MPANTPNYNWNLPTEGSDSDLWGGFLNANWSDLDTLIKTLEDRIEALKIPVGGIYMSGSSEDPATALGYGTWVAKAEGRAIVGVGNNGESDWTNNEIRGTENVSLLASQMPTHSHNVNPPPTNTDSRQVFAQWNDVVLEGDTGVFGDGYKVDQFANTRQTGGGPVAVKALALDNNHAHTVDIPEFTSGPNGSGVAHENVQPSIAVYIWQRQA